VIFPVVLGYADIYYSMSNRIKIKCRECGSVFFQDMFQEHGAGAICSCEGLTIKALKAPETRFGYWLTVEYAQRPPLITEKTFH
jgi:hypothetical protein